MVIIGERPHIIVVFGLHIYGCFCGKVTGDSLCQIGALINSFYILLDGSVCVLQLHIGVVV